MENEKNMFSKIFFLASEGHPKTKEQLPKL